MRAFRVMALLGLVLTLSGCVFFDDSGLWRGEAVSQDGVREAFACRVQVDLSHTESDIALHEVSTDCGAYAQRWEGGNFEVHGTTVWREGRAVGWADRDGAVTLDIDRPSQALRSAYPYPADRLVVSWRRVGQSLEYTEEDHFGSRVQSTHGWLYPAN